LERGSLHRFGSLPKAAGTAALQDAPATHKRAWPSGRDGCPQPSASDQPGGALGQHALPALGKL